MNRIRSSTFSTRALLLVLVLLLVAPVPSLLANASGSKRERVARYVIHISVDGLRPEAIRRHSPKELPNFYRLREEGAFTDNARTDVDYSNTLPNHTTQLTSRPVMGTYGHNWTSNGVPGPDETLHSNKGRYVASVFDVAHDHGLRTGAYVSKKKFVLFDRSYDENHGAVDVTGEDNGRDKIDTFVINKETKDLVAQFVRDMKADPYHYAFVHLRDPDATGHTRFWNLRKSSPYMRAIRKVDGLLGQILDMIDNDPRLKGNTTIVLTADHGGTTFNHGNPARASNYTIPFYVWGAGVTSGDLYELNRDVRKDPEGGRPGYSHAMQPIRNGEAGNFALSLLGLPPIPGSQLNVIAQLGVSVPENLAADEEAPRNENNPVLELMN